MSDASAVGSRPSYRGDVPKIRRRLLQCRQLSCRTTLIAGQTAGFDMFGDPMLVPHLQHLPHGMLGTLSPPEIEDLLQTEVVARLGCHAEGRTYVVPITYAYDGEGLLIQSGDGLKLRMMHENPWVCVEVDHIDNLANWRNVIARGRFEELLGDDATAALVRLRARLEPLIVSETTGAERLAAGEAPLRAGDGHASIYRIHLFERTGRFERR
jgi:nitroimidazol reductase NimA-like FMN-containing flavoprotein (pyridoxamine 5'-phosphate oxidase superfamily)